MDESSAQQAALRAIDKVLENRPHKDAHELSEAARCLSQLRDEMIARRPATGASSTDRERLARLNSILSVVMGAEFPIGNIPWQELEKARDWLEDLLSEADTL